MGILAIILGIFGIVCAWFPVIQYAALALSIVGIILISTGLKNSGRTGRGKASSVVGLIFCIMATIFSGIGIFICTVAVAGAAANTPDALEGLKNTSEALDSAKDLSKALEELENTATILENIKTQ